MSTGCDPAAGNSSSSHGTSTAHEVVLLTPNATAARARKRVLLGVVLAAGSQLGWGLYPVFARALQTQQPSLSTLELLIALNAISATALLVLSGAKALLRATFVRMRGGNSSGGSGGGSAASRPSAKGNGPVARWLKARPRFTVAIFSLVIAARAISNVASAAFAPAHWLVMIALTTPFFTAALGRFVFGDPLPPGTLPALLCGLFGSGLAIWGGRAMEGDEQRVADARHAEQQQQQSMGGGGGNNFTGLSGEGSGVLAPAPSMSELMFGVGLAFLSTIALALYQHLVQLTKGLLAESQVLALNYAVVLTPCVAVLGIETWMGEADFMLGKLRALGVLQWVYLLLFALVVYVGANLAQQLAIRSLGPTLLAAVMPLRLVSSVAGSYAVLGEGIDSAAEALGLLLVALTAIAYLSHRVLRVGGGGTSKSAGASAATPPARRTAASGSAPRPPPPLRSEDPRHVDAENARL